MNSEHSVDVDELIKKYNEQWEQLKAITLLYNHEVKVSQDLECCGNCENLVVFHRWKIECALTKDETLVCNYCDKYQSDGMSRVERRIK